MWRILPILFSPSIMRVHDSQNHEPSIQKEFATQHFIVEQQTLYYQAILNMPIDYLTISSRCFQD